MTRPFTHPAPGTTINDQFASFAYTQPDDPSSIMVAARERRRRDRVGKAILRPPASSASFYLTARHRRQFALQNRVDRQRRSVRYNLADPTVVAPMQLPLLDQRTVRVETVGLHRGERIRRRPAYRLAPPPTIIIIPSVEATFRTIRVQLAGRSRIELIRRKPTSHLFPAMVVTGSILQVGRSSSPSAGILSAPIIFPPAVRIVAPPWRFVVATLGGKVLADLERVATARTVTITMNQPMQATGVVPSDDPRVNTLGDDGDPFLAEGTRLLYGFRREGYYGTNITNVAVYQPWRVRFGGMLLQIDDSVSNDAPISAYTAFDPWQYLMSRPCVYFTGELPGPKGMTFVNVPGSEIALQLLHNTIVNHGFTHIDVPAAYGGSGFYGTDANIQPGGTDPITITFAQGLSVGEAWTQLTDTQSMDIVLRPIFDPINRPGYTSELGIHGPSGNNPGVGIDRPGAIFGWDKAPRSAVGIDRLEDGTQRMNSAQYFLQSGVPLDPILNAASIAKFGEYWGMQTMPAVTAISLLLSIVQGELQTRKQRATTINVAVTPQRGPVVFNEYDIGDTVRLYASSRLRKPITTKGRIYSIPIDIGDDNIETVSALDFSSDTLG